MILKESLNVVLTEPESPDLPFILSTLNKVKDLEEKYFKPIRHDLQLMNDEVFGNKEVSVFI